MNVENNVLPEEMTEADSGAEAKTLVAAIVAQDHHDRVAVEAEDAISVTAADETDVIDMAVAAVKTGDKTDVHLKVKPHPKFKEIYQVMLEDGAQRLATKNLTPGFGFMANDFSNSNMLNTEFGMLSAANLQEPLLKACKTCL